MKKTDMRGSFPSNIALPYQIQKTTADFSNIKNEFYRCIIRSLSRNTFFSFYFSSHLPRVLC